MFRELYYGVMTAMIGIIAWYPEGFGFFLSRIYKGFIEGFFQYGLI